MISLVDKSKSEMMDKDKISTLWIVKRLNSKEVANLFMVQWVDVLVDRVPSQLHLTEAEVDTGGLTDVHDLPVRGQHKDEPV